MTKNLLRSLASLKFTMVLLALAMFLILAGTLAQRSDGIWQVQKHYFHSVMVLVPLEIFLPSGLRLPGAIPFPGGYLLGTALLVNLVAAKSMRLVLSWQRIGLWMTHAGLILLLLGEGITSGMAREGRMQLAVGAAGNYVESAQQVELALVDTSAADHDRHMVIAYGQLSPGKVISNPRLPVDLVIDALYPNADVAEAEPSNASQAAPLANGAEQRLVLIPRPALTGAAADESANQPAAYVALRRQGASLGTFLLSTALAEGQRMAVDGKTYELSLRPTRTYKPYKLELLKFTRDNYPGTDVARRYSSLVRLVDERYHVDRQVLIEMNAPLRYRGDTIYQSGFQGDSITILQVVRNPAWMLPYIACGIGGLGLVLHCVIRLGIFLGQRAAGKRQGGTPQMAALAGVPPRRSRQSLLRGGNLAPWCAGLCMLALVAAAAWRDSPTTKPSFDLAAFGRLPVHFEGRVQPLDSVARNAMKVLRGRQTAQLDNQELPAIEWLLDVLRISTFRDPAQLRAADPAMRYKIFRIDFPDVLDLLRLPRQEVLFSLNEVLPRVDELYRQQEKALTIPAAQRDAFQTHVIEQVDRFSLWSKINQVDDLFLVAPLRPHETWQKYGAAWQNPSFPGNQESLRHLRDILLAYAQQRPVEFNQELEAYHRALENALPAVTTRVNFEAFFNRFDPLFQAWILYIMALLLGALSWLFWPEPLRRSGLALLSGALLLHTFGLVCRIYISGHPPVTNLASSAIFIGWVAVVVALVLEWLYHNGIGIVAAGVVAIPTLLIASRLSLDGDTTKVLVAVLDTNIWLATHVVVVTMGYAATFLAGAIALGYIFFGVCTPVLSPERRTNLIRMVWGVTCFALIGSFIGTVLGGIWADQSWGRFWGWDPKENGAILIVLAQALLLHARWAGWAGERGLAGLAVFGNMVTAWSWFGTNMLGVGLHSYGFMPAAFWGLIIFMAVQMGFIIMAMIPHRLWRSVAAFRKPEPVLESHG